MVYMTSSTNPSQAVLKPTCKARLRVAQQTCRSSSLDCCCMIGARFCPLHDMHAGDEMLKLYELQIEDGSLGSPPAEQILHELQPAHWFSAHLHVKYAAVVPHTPPQQTHQGRGQKRKSPNRGVSPPPGLGRGTGKGKQERVKVTKFLALDKCLPRRGFLQVNCNAQLRSQSSVSSQVTRCNATFLTAIACATCMS